MILPSSAIRFFRKARALRKDAERLGKIGRGYPRLGV